MQTIPLPTYVRQWYEEITTKTDHRNKQQKVDNNLHK
jgi:hypothetical protein